MVRLLIRLLGGFLLVVGITLVVLFFGIGEWWIIVCGTLLMFGGAFVLFRAR